MRKIKFRVWGPNSKYLWSWEELVANDTSMRWMQPSFGEKVLMQYTGLQDKNGTEIYEGDVIESKVNMIFDNGTHRQVVEFKNGMFMLGCCSLFNSTGAPQHFEPVVIGNIYENPDLIGDPDA